jgi:hypothetical protein
LASVSLLIPPGPRLRLLMLPAPKPMRLSRPIKPMIMAPMVDLERRRKELSMDEETLSDGG